MNPNDPLYPSQWHFSLMGNIQKIWDEFSGAGVNVGVYDTGIDYNHPDLTDNYNSSLHVLDDLGNILDPFPIGNGAHGTACAGLIGAAANNGIGGTGVASGVELTGVNIFGGGFGDVNGVTANFLFIVHQAATNFDISSNSWGATPLFFNGLADGGFADQLEDEYAFLSASGRNGLGTVITQAAGNDTLDANGDGTNASRYTITVAATEQTGIIASYSNFGASILVAAPAAAVTTDISGAPGYDPGDYTTSFNGTSAATPVVSGVIALMLEANPGLGWRDVQNILANSASHTGSAFGGPQDVAEHGQWGFNSASGWNGGGLHSQIDYGYGMVNAYNAVRMAEVWGLFGAAQTSANEVSVTSNLNNLSGLAVPDNDPLGGVNFNLTVGPDIEIDHVQLAMNFSHTFVGNLKVTLTSAAGTTIIAQLNTNIGTNFNGEWRFGIDSLRGELSAGTWTVNVADVALGDVGVLNTAQLNVFGSALSADDVHHITDEYLAMVALDAGRGTIVDGNGGTDWLDMSTIAGNVILNLANGSSFSVNGVNWGALGAAADIENAVTGDGNDMITGNSNANIIHGMRGNDTIDGGGGVDTMTGGLGNDIYFVDNALDFVIEKAEGGKADRVQTSVNYALAVDQQIELLSTTNSAGLAAISLTGNNLANRILGNNGINIINGGGGIDHMTGLTGNDLYYVDNILDLVIESINGGTLDRVLTSVSYTLGANQQIELFSTTNSTSTGAINLIGNNLANTILGNNGDNFLNGSGGADRMTGLNGNDQYFVDNALDVVVESVNGGTADRVFTSVDYTLGVNQQIEIFSTLNSAGTGAINLIGNNLANSIAGNNGINIINGGGGVDRLNGLLGNDLYYVDNALDVVIESAGGGTLDQVLTTVDYTLGLNQQIELFSTTDSLGVGAMNLTGNNLSNNMQGNNGVNVINGGLANDFLTGGLGADQFVFNTAITGGGNLDTIADFVHGIDDFQLSQAIFANIGVTLDLNELKQGIAAATGTEHIIYDGVTGNLFFDVDGFGATAQVQFAKVTAGIVLNTGDFIMV